MSSDAISCLWTDALDRDEERSFVERHGNVNEITAGTILEYDDWQWAVVTELAVDRETPKVGFVLLDELDDRITDRMEQANGCRQHYSAVKHLRGGEHEYWTTTEYVTEDDIWTVLGPIHPELRDDGGPENE